MKLYVGNLSFETTENDLRDLFEQHGTVTDVAILNDRETGRSRGFGFVTFTDATGANAAIAALERQGSLRPCPDRERSARA